jgi:hypothetical protein
MQGARISHSSNSHAPTTQIGRAPPRRYFCAGRSRGILAAMRKPLFVAGLAGVMLASGGARAAVTIVFQRGTSAPGTVYVDGARMRMDAPEKSERFTTIIIDATTKRQLMIDDKNKTYTEITDEDRKRMKAQMEAMRAQMQERMKQMPPEQRKKMEDIMGPMGEGEGKQRDWSYERLGQKKTINGFACETYKVVEDGKPIAEVCVTPWSAGLLKKEDFAGISKYAEEMMADMGVGHRARASNVFGRLEKAPGFPVSRVPIEEGGARGPEEQIKSIKRGGIPASMFTVPAGYTKKDLPAMMGGGMGAHHGGPPPH